MSLPTCPSNPNLERFSSGSSGGNPRCLALGEANEGRVVNSQRNHNDHNSGMDCALEVASKSLAPCSRHDSPPNPLPSRPCADPFPGLARLRIRRDAAAAGAGHRQLYVDHPGPGPALHGPGPDHPGGGPGARPGHGQSELFRRCQPGWCRPELSAAPGRLSASRRWGTDPDRQLRGVHRRRFFIARGHSGPPG